MPTPCIIIIINYHYYYCYCYLPDETELQSNLPQSIQLGNNKPEFKFRQTTPRQLSVCVHTCIRDYIDESTYCIFKIFIPEIIMKDCNQISTHTINIVFPYFIVIENTEEYFSLRFYNINVLKLGVQSRASIK